MKYSIMNRRFVRYLLTLAFVPVNKLREVYSQIRAKFNVSIQTFRNFEQLWSFISYYETEWLADLEKWNLSTIPRHRTNNHVEGFQRYSIFNKTN